MINQSDLKRVLERLHEAEQLIKVGIEKGKLSTIERDILLEKFRVSYEMILFGGKEEKAMPTTQQIIIPKSERIVVSQPKETKIPATEPEVKPVSTPPKQKQPTLQEPEQKSAIEAVEEEIAIPEIEDISADTEEFEEDDFQEKAKTSVLGEKFQGTRKFRNETLGKGKKDIATKLQNKPINDLTKAIGINDKFLFTKELFNGNAELYAKTIVKLNEFTDINDAIFYVQDNFKWDDKNEAANQLMELVRRKLLID